MRLKFVGLGLSMGLFALSATATSVAVAQDDPEGDIDQCRSLSSASRTRSNACGNDGAAEAQSVEHELTLTLERPVIHLSQCQATLAIDYVQSGAFASVDGVLQNEVCGASGGEFTISARIRDANGETQSLEFTENWQRDDDQPVTFSAEYPIGANVELLSVRARKLSCECAEAP